MLPSNITFEQIFERWNWRQIRNCPGRFALIGGRSKLTVEEIVEAEVEVYNFISPKASDEISVVKFSDGGFISYHKPDNEFLHTLNTHEGFFRKLKQLEINLLK